MKVACLGSAILSRQEIRFLLRERHAPLLMQHLSFSLLLLCNKSLGDGREVDDWIDAMTEALLKGRWCQSEASEQRRTGLLPRFESPSWDELMVQPRYMQCLDLLP